MDDQESNRPAPMAGNEGSPPLEELLAEMTAAEPERAFHGEGAGDPEERGGESEPYIRFRVDGVHFAVPLKHALEVGKLPGVTPLPNLPGWVSGISNIRGDVVSIVDLKAFFGRSPSAPPAGGSMILLQTHHLKVGFRVDRLDGIASLSEGEWTVSSNPFTKGDITPYLAGVAATGDSLLYLLDVKALLTSSRMNSFRKA
ncbi:chemotaxis protein CheW [Desulfoluna spongiiphila]|uniref:Purine-binding chemotaxis protein CheW n=1 Tax=Desulfoluna spongiiphila TaxID=419481 RepID=A0A1G5CVJ7_9BACT|nr:chemotaxis protein CheW [Desulfoluna spongiiphila]SCY06432.1 purine-binding chemotaxis protein CheW [Desulfoluna spongiiphila]